MSAVLPVLRFGEPIRRHATFSKMEVQSSPFLDATFWNYLLQKTDALSKVLPFQLETKACQIFFSKDTPHDDNLLIDFWAYCCLEVVHKYYKVLYLCIVL